MTYNITLTANHQSLTAEYLPLAAESVQYLTAKVVCETEDWTGREIKAMFGQGCTVHEVSVIDGEITAKQQLNLTAGDWRVWLIGNSARDGEVIPRITTNIAHISVAPTGGTEGNPFPATPPTVEEQLRADMGDLADLTTEDKSSLVAAINEAAESGGSKDAVTYTPQTLTEEQKSQARTNIGAEKAGTGYTKPTSGIPKSDLEQSVQTSLDKADTALQSQTIPDWNQNDETAPDYVKNRPFYTGNPVETVLVEESTVSFTDDGGIYFAELESTFVPTVGEIYKVSWDGTVYECTCVEGELVYLIGNPSIEGAGSDTGEPFCMYIHTNGFITIVTADTSDSHTFSIIGIVEPIVKIPAKYIDKNDSGYIAIHSKDTMTEQEAEDYYNEILGNEVVFIIWDGMCISGINFVGTNGHDLQLTTQSGETYLITKNDDGLFALSDMKLYRALFPNSVAMGYNVISINVSEKKISIFPKIISSGVGSADALFRVESNGTESKAFEVLGNGEAVTPALILYSSTADSTKKFRITVDDSGTLTATEVS